MIAVTGASGKLGRLVVEGLLKEISAGQIVAIVRNPEKVSDLAARGVVVRHGDYSSPDTLGPAVAGVKRLLLVSSSEVGKRTAQHGAVIDAAKQAGVELIAYTSILRAESSGLLLATEHRATEELLRASGVPFVLLRNGWYIENYTENVATALKLGSFFGSAGEGRIAAAPRSDYSAAAIAVLTRDKQAGKIYELAGDQSFTMSELAAAVSDWAGKTIAYTDLPPDEYKKALLGAGLPEGFAAVLVDADLGVRRGELDSTSKDLHQLIGRDTETLSEVLARLPKP